MDQRILSDQRIEDAASTKADEAMFVELTADELALVSGGVDTRSDPMGGG